MSEHERYRRVLGVDVAPDKTPSTRPPPGEIMIAGRGWKFSAPAAILLALGSALASAIGTRMLPTPTPTDTRIDSVIAQQTRAQRDDEQFRGDVRAELVTVRQSLQATEEYLRKRLTLQEDRLEAHEERDRRERDTTERQRRDDFFNRNFFRAKPRTP